MNVKQLIASADLIRAVQAKRHIVVVAGGKAVRLELRRLAAYGGYELSDEAPASEANVEVHDPRDGSRVWFSVCELIEQLAEGSALVLPD